MARLSSTWILRSLGAVFGLLLVVMVAVLIVRPVLDLDRLRPTIEDELTRRLGTPVSVGELRFRASLWPELFVRDIRVATSDPLGTLDVTRIDRGEIQVSLLPLVLKRIHIIRVRVEDCEVALEPALELFANGSSEEGGSPNWALVGLRKLEGVDIELRQVGPQGSTLMANVASLSAGVTQTIPLKLEAIGRFDGAPSSLTVDGPPIGDLLRPPRVLPLTASLTWADFQASAEVTLSSDRILLDSLLGALDDSPFSGRIEVATSEDRPRVSGHIRLDRIGLDRWLPPSEAGDRDPTTPALLRHRLLEWEGIELPVDWLSVADLDLALRVDRVDDLPLDATGLQAQLNLDRGTLEAPLTMTIAGALLEFRLLVESQAEEPSLSLDATLDGLSLERLAALDSALAPLSGEVGRLHLEARTSGSNLAAMIEESAIDLELQSSAIRLTQPDHDRRLDLGVDTLQLTRRPGEGLRLDLDGSLQDQELRLQAQGPEWLDLEPGHSWPVGLTLESLSLEAEMTAAIVLDDVFRRFAADYRIGADRASDLSQWLGLPAGADLPVALEGTVLVEAGQARLAISDGKLGSSAFSGDVLVDRHPHQRLQIELDIDQLDTRELESFAEPIEAGEISDASFRLDIPVLPASIELPDTEIHLSIGRIERELQDLTEIRLELEFAQQRLQPSTLAFQLGDSRLEGTVELSWREEVPRIRLHFDADHLDIGHLIDLDTIGEGVSLEAHNVELSFESEGRTMRELLSLEADVRASARSVIGRIPLNQHERVHEIRLDSLSLEAPRGQEMSIEAAGELNNEQIEVTAVVEAPAGYRVGDHLPVEAQLRLAEAEAEIRADLAIPLDLDRQRLHFRLAAPQLSHLNGIADLDLPEVGPLRLAASLEPSESGFELEIEELVLAGSELRGDFRVDTGAQRPQLTAVLEAQRIAPGDFLGEPPESIDAAKPAGESEVEPIRFPVNLAWMRRFDATFSLQIDEIDWGHTTGGGGRIEATLQDSRLSLSRLELSQEDSIVDLRSDLQLFDDRLEADLALRLEGFRYGPVVTAFDPEGEEDGSLSLDTELAMSGATFDEMIASGSGHFDFTLYPESVDTKLLDLWAASFASVLRILNPGNQSKLNCLTGSFRIEAGKMTVDTLFLDTTQIRARGHGEIDLDAATARLKLNPRPKRRTFLNLATPIRLTGPIADPEIRASVGGLAGTGFRLFAWVYTWYLEFFRQPLPRDGADICVDPQPRRAMPDVIE